jgi:glycosyltransferase involved in cell wall biosynthesis
MKKLLFLIPNLKHGGAEKVLVNLVNNLDKKKFEVTLYSIFDVGVNKDFLNGDVRYKYKFKKYFRGNTYFFNLFSPGFLFKWLIKEEFDVVISYLEGPATRVISGCRNPSTKKIAWIHIELNMQQIHTGFRNIEEATENYSKFNCIVGVSKKVIEDFGELIPCRVPLKVLYNTIETESILALGNEPVDVYFESDVINIMSVGKIIKTKGFDRLLEVHKKLIDDGYRVKTYILGIGQEMTVLKDKAKELNISDSFIFLGFDKNPYKYLSKCDLYVCASHREGFSTAVTEALVLGIPVVSTEVSGAKELLGENNEFGIVTENSTNGIYLGLKEMLDKPEKLAHYKDQAIARGNMFSKDNAVKVHEEFFDSLL